MANRWGFQTDPHEARPYDGDGAFNDLQLPDGVRDNHSSPDGFVMFPDCHTGVRP